MYILKTLQYNTLPSYCTHLFAKNNNVLHEVPCAVLYCFSVGGHSFLIYKFVLTLKCHIQITD